MNSLLKVRHNWEWRMPASILVFEAWKVSVVWPNKWHPWRCVHASNMTFNVLPYFNATPHPTQLTRQFYCHWPYFNFFWVNPHHCTQSNFPPWHLRRRLRHFFEFMSKVTFLCYFFKILCYFSKILCYFFEILCYFFPNLFRLNKNLFHLSNNYVITPIIMCVRDNICWLTSHRNSIKAKLCCFHHIMNERVANSDTLIIFSALTYFFDLNWQRITHARGRFTK